MRLLFLSTWPPFPPDNGSKTRAYHLLAALAQRHEVHCLAFAPGARVASGPLPGWAARISYQGVEVDPFRHVNKPQVVKYLSPIPLAYVPSRTMRAVLAGLHGPWDAVVSVQMPVAQYAQHDAHAAVIDVDASLSHQMQERLNVTHGVTARAKASIAYQKARLYERRALRRYDLALIAGGQEQALVEELAACGPRVEVLPNGVDCERNRPGLFQQVAGRLVFNGALTYTANYDAMQWFLASVYPLIVAGCPSANLAITGSTAGVDRAGLALTPSVELTGYVGDIREPVCEAAVCVAPLRQGWGTRLKILEAMALGTPVVSTTKGAEGLSVTDGEDIIIADRPDEFAARTLRLLKDPAERTRLATNARRLVEAQYDWASIGSRFASLVEETVVRRECATRSTVDR
jgi:polysaccharide biosynthesis protein PslH